MQWQHGVLYTTVRPIATQFPGHGCMEDLTTERGFDSHAVLVIDVLVLLACYPWVFVKPGTGIRPVDRCRNKMTTIKLGMFHFSPDSY